MIDDAKTSYEFDSFRLIPAERQLLRDGMPVSMPPKAFDTLIVLVENHGHALTKDDLMKRVWPDSFVEESNLNHYISILRKTVSDGENGDGYVETVRGYGFRFNADVREISHRANALFVHKRTRTRVVVREESSEELKFTRVERTINNRRVLRTRILTLGLLGAIAVLGITLWAVFLSRPNEPEQTRGAPVIRSIAVLPFKSLNATGDDEYLELGIADSLITKLGKIGSINVRPTSSIEKYKAADRDAIAVGRELKVDSVLDGRIQRSGERLRITVHLLNVKDGTSLWMEEFDGKHTDIFNMQDSIGVRVARTVAPNLTGEELARLAKRGTENAEAYQAYLKGRYFWNKRTAEGSLKSIEYFRRAIELDPKFALAYVGLADAYNYSPQTRSQKGPLMKAALKTALAMDGTLAEAHATLANLSFFYDWDWAEAEWRFQRALELNPNYATAHHWYAYYLAARGRLDEALTEIRRAQELDPLSLIINTDVGQILCFARRYDQAIEQLRRTLEMDQNFVMARWRLSEAYALRGMHAEAIAELQKAQELLGQDRFGALVHVYAFSGKREKAMDLLDEWSRQFPRGSLPIIGDLFSVATAYSALGEKDKAFYWLDKGYQGGHAEMVLIGAEPWFDNLRTDPRFQDLLGRMNLN